MPQNTSGHWSILNATGSSFILTIENNFLTKKYPFMLHKLKLTCLAAGVALLCSCAAKKQLASTQADLETQEQKNAQLQKELGSTKNQLSTAQNQNKALSDQNQAL